MVEQHSPLKANHGMDKGQVVMVRLESSYAFLQALAPEEPTSIDNLDFPNRASRGRAGTFSSSVRGARVRRLHHFGAVCPSLETHYYWVSLSGWQPCINRGAAGRSVRNYLSDQ